MNEYIQKTKGFNKFNICNLEKLFLPLAAFFLLISTALLNVFVLLAVICTIMHLIYERSFSDLISKKFMLYGLLIFLFLDMSLYFTIGDVDSIISSLKKYIKFLYIPFLYININRNKNSDLVIKYFIAGGVVVLFMSYLKYFNFVDLKPIYDYYNMNLVGTITQASVFQTSIVHGAIFSFISYLSIFVAKRDNNKWLYIFSALCLINIFFMNDSRNSYIIASIFIFLIIYYHFYKIKYLFTTLSLLVTFFIFLSPISENLIKSMHDTNKDIKLLIDKNYTSSIGLRTLWLSIGIQNLNNEPILGSGVGSYKNSVQHFLEKNTINVKHDLAISNNPHNEFVSMSTQLGLFGLSLYILFLYSLFKEARKRYLAIGAFVIIFVSSFFNSVFYDNVFGLFIVIMLSLVYQKNYLE